MPPMPTEDAAQAGGHDAHPAGGDHRGHWDTHRHCRQHPQHHRCGLGPGTTWDSSIPPSFCLPAAAPFLSPNPSSLVTFLPTNLSPNPPTSPPNLAPMSPPFTGDLIHLSNSNVQDLQPSELGAEPPALRVASRAYNLSSALMCILMRSRVLNEEPLTLAGEEIVAQGKRSDPLSLLCQGNASGPGCHFSIPAAFSGALSNLSDVVQLIFLVDSNPFPFGYISNYTVSTKVASMAFQTQAGTQIPIGQLASERAITVKVPNSPDQAARVHRIPAGSAIVPPRASVSAVVTPNHSKPEAGLHLQLTYTVLNGGCHGPGSGLWGSQGGARAFSHIEFLQPCRREGSGALRGIAQVGGHLTLSMLLPEHYLSEEPEPYLAVYLHSAPWPNEHNCSASRRISPEALLGKDHRPYTFFIAPG